VAMADPPKNANTLCKTIALDRNEFRYGQWLWIVAATVHPNKNCWVTRGTGSTQQ
jgi:hypothetical protein